MKKQHDGIIVYDLETTGLINHSRNDLPGITQIAAVLYDWDGTELDHFETKVNPELPADDWEKGAIKVTGIKPEDVTTWPSFFEVFIPFADFVARGSVFSGYNILEYDDIVLYNNLVRYGFEKHFPWPRRRLDVMHIATQYANKQGKRGSKRPRLGDIYKELFNEELEGWHDALNDVRGTGRVLFEIGSEEAMRFKS